MHVGDVLDPGEVDASIVQVGYSKKHWSIVGLWWRGVRTVEDAEAHVAQLPRFSCQDSPSDSLSSWVRIVLAAFEAAFICSRTAWTSLGNFSSKSSSRSPPSA